MRIARLNDDSQLLKHQRSLLGVKLPITFTLLDALDMEIIHMGETSVRSQRINAYSLHMREIKAKASSPIGCPPPEKRASKMRNTQQEVILDVQCCPLQLKATFRLPMQHFNRWQLSQLFDIWGILIG